MSKDSYYSLLRPFAHLGAFLPSSPNMFGRNYISSFNTLIVGIYLSPQQMKKTLCGMSKKNLMKFLSFIHKYLTENHSKDECWKQFELILSGSPIMTIADFLLSLDNIQRKTLLKKCGILIANFAVYEFEVSTKR